MANFAPRTRPGQKTWRPRFLTDKNMQTAGQEKLLADTDIPIQRKLHACGAIQPLASGRTPTLCQNAGSSSKMTNFYCRKAKRRLSSKAETRICHDYDIRKKKYSKPSHCRQLNFSSGNHDRSEIFHRCRTEYYQTLRRYFAQIQVVIHQQFARNMNWLPLPAEPHYTTLRTNILPNYDAAVLTA